MFPPSMANFIERKSSRSFAYSFRSCLATVLLSGSKRRIQQALSTSSHFSSDSIVARRSCAFSSSRSSLSLKKSIFLISLARKQYESTIKFRISRISCGDAAICLRNFRITNMAVVSTRRNYTRSHSSSQSNVVIWRTRSDKEASWSRALSKYPQRPQRYRWLVAWAGYSCYNNDCHPNYPWML